MGNVYLPLSTLISHAWRYCSKKHFVFIFDWLLQARPSKHFSCLHEYCIQMSRFPMHVRAPLLLTTLQTSGDAVNAQIVKVTNNFEALAPGHYWNEMQFIPYFVQVLRGKAIAGMFVVSICSLLNSEVRTQVHVQLWAGKLGWFCSILSLLLHLLLESVNFILESPPGYLSR